jgi:hypothetical protein
VSLELWMVLGAVIFGLGLVVGLGLGWLIWLKW